MSIHYGGRGPGHIARVQGGGPTRSLDFSTSLPSGVTFSRGSSATYFDSAGVLQTASSNVARIDYNPATLVSRGLLIEEARTNLCLYSDDLTNAAWTKTNCTAAKTATGPDGVSNSASTLTATAGNATVLQAITSGSAARITSCLIKRRTGSGTIEMTQDNGTTWAAVTVTSSWTRVNIASATLTNPTVGLRIVTNGDAVDVAVFQNELGAFITSPIPTAGSTVARSADSASMTGTDFSSWYNQTEGTFVYEAAVFAVGSTVRVISIDNDSANERMVSSAHSDSHWEIRVGGVLQARIDAGGWTANSSQKAALAYKVNDFAASLGGGAAVTDTVGTIPTVDRLRIFGEYTGSTTTSGHIKSLRYYNTRLPDASLQALTA